MLYNGQEVGEPAADAEGFGGDDARTSIFDYWSMPEFVKWVNGHRYDGGRLSPEQKALRAFYSRLVNLVGEPAFQDGEFFPLNPANHDNPSFGRLSGEQASGHWLYSFLRYEIQRGQLFLVVANLHPSVTWQNVRVIFSDSALNALPFRAVDRPFQLVDRLADPEGAPISSTIGEALGPGVLVGELRPLSACYFEISWRS